MNIIFINPRPAQCSIYQTGKNFFEMINCDDYTLHYAEISDLSREDFLAGKIVGENLLNYYDVYIFNYHPITLCKHEGIGTDAIKNFGGIKINLSFEVGVNDPYPIDIYNMYAFFDTTVFDHHIIFDSGLYTSNQTFHPFWRPIKGFRYKDRYRSIPKIPIIGSHGLPNKEKNHDKLMQQASIEFERSIVRINMPHATHMGEGYTQMIVDECLQNKPDNVELILTHTYFQNREDLIDWCSQNDLNVFMYTRNQAGISSATDEAILSGSPISISNDIAFRNLHPYIRPFPEWNFTQSILNSQNGIAQFREQLNRNDYLNRFKKIINMV